MVLCKVIIWLCEIVLCKVVNSLCEMVLCKVVEHLYCFENVVEQMFHEFLAIKNAPLFSEALLFGNSFTVLV